jgi:hypothetical protein
MENRICVMAKSSKECETLKPEVILIDKLVKLLTSLVVIVS